MVIWSRPARDDLKCIFDYISKDSKFYAEKVIYDIVDITELLLESPEMGRVVPELKNQNIREIFKYSYRIIYKIVNPQEIHVLALVHFKQNFLNSNFQIN